MIKLKSIKFVLFSIFIYILNQMIFMIKFCCSHFLYVYSIATLYNWRYKKLGNLSHVHLKPEFHMANPGFHFDFQLINVEDFNGVGESEPNPYFYQVSAYVYVCSIQMIKWI